MIGEWLAASLTWPACHDPGRPGRRRETVAELIDMLHREPDKYSYASSGNGE